MYGGLCLPRWLSDRESSAKVGNVGSIPGLVRSPGGGNGNAFQYFAWEIHGWGTWWTTVLGVAKNQTQLSARVHTHTRTCAHTWEPHGDSKGNQRMEACIPS